MKGWDLVRIFFSAALSHPFFPLAVVFLALNLIVTQDGGQNAKSRMLPMRSFVEEGNFRMDPYLKVTDDWSLSPNGHYYSNKAPGPMILGLPAFFTLDKLHQLTEKGYRDERGMRPDPGYFQHTWLSFLMQALPFAILVLACATWLGSQGVGWSGQLFFVLAAFFANTASFFFNSYFGHGFSALLQLAALLFLFRRRFSLAGMMFSLSLLSDYGFVMEIPALLAVLALVRPGWRGLGKFSLGAVPGAILWIVYHWTAFGSPLVTAGQFQNGTFVAEKGAWLGVLSPPDFSILGELLWGNSRGLVLSQPWLLWLAPFALWMVFRRGRNRILLELAAFCFLGLAGLLLFNASFNGWHGGATPGPRYLSAVLPAWALLGGLMLARLPGPARGISWALLGLGLIFRGLVYAGTLLAPNAPLWSFYLHELGTRATPVLRLVIFLLLVGLGTYLSWRRRGRAILGAPA